MTHEEAVERHAERLNLACATNYLWSEDTERGMLDILSRHTPDHGAAYVEPNGGATMTPCRECRDDWPCPDARACGVTS